jgi:hypothetical protein
MSKIIDKKWHINLDVLCARKVVSRITDFIYTVYKKKKLVLNKTLHETFYLFTHNTKDTSLSTNLACTHRISRCRHEICVWLFFYFIIFWRQEHTHPRSNVNFWRMGEQHNAGGIVFIRSWADVGKAASALQPRPSSHRRLIGQGDD